MIRYACGHTVDDPRTIQHRQVCMWCWDASRIPIDVYGPHIQGPPHPKDGDQWETVTISTNDAKIIESYEDISSYDRYEIRFAPTARINPYWIAVEHADESSTAHSPESE